MLFFIQKILTFNLGVSFLKSVRVYFEIKNGDDLFFCNFLTGNKFGLKHASMMCMCNKIKSKAGLSIIISDKYLMCSLVQKCILWFCSRFIVFRIALSFEHTALQRKYRLQM